MNFKLFFICLSILFFMDSSAQVEISKPIHLNFEFKEEHPIDFVLREKKIFVSTGKQIYCFNLSGNFLHKTTFNKIAFASFDVRIINGVLKYYLLGNGKLYIFNSKRLEIEIDLRCQNIKVNSDGIVYFDYQEPPNSNIIEDEIVIDKIGAFDFRTKKTSRFKLKCNALVQTIDTSGSIYWVYDNMIYFLNPKIPYLKSNDLTYPFDGTSKFIGFMNGKSYIKFYGGHHLDSFYVLNNKLNKVDLKGVDLSFGELHNSVKQNHDYLMEDHAGLHYFYDGKNAIYYMRYTRLYCEIGLLESVLK